MPGRTGLTMVVTIDGPAGTGKSSVSKQVARRLGFMYLDTGALYRTVALAALEQGMDQAAETALAAWLPGLKLAMRPHQGRMVIELDGRDVEPHIRNERVAGAASRLSALEPVRAWLLETQRLAGAGGQLVAEGRDMGTVVFPHAQAKFFLTASVAERARRRYLELAAKGDQVELAAMERDIAARDQRDMDRALSPLKPAAEAQIIDTTGLTLEQVIERVLAATRQAGKIQ